MPRPKKYPPVGSPTKLNQRLIDIICQHLLMGNYLEVAAAAAGVSYSSVSNWLRWGRERPRSIYRRFSDAAMEAQARYEANAVANIERAAKGVVHALLLKDENGNQLYDKEGLPLFIKPQPPDWQAEAWRLERKHSNRWSKLERQEISTNQGPVVQITLPSNARELPPANEDTSSDILEVPLLSSINKDNDE